MFENDADSDDDFEGYFLRPANEYNISEKIKEANKELFSTPNPLSPSLLNQRRKVSFRPNLEDFEPINEQQQQQMIEEIQSSTTLTESNISRSILVDTEILEIIESPVHIAKEAEIKNLRSMSDSESEIEEVCGELLEFDVNDNDKVDEEELGEKLSIPIRNSPPPRPGNIDMLPLSKSTENEYENQSDTDDDDNLSVIVASYLRHDSKDKLNEDEKIYSSASKNFLHKNLNPFRFCNKNQKNKISGKNVNDDIMELKLNYKTCCEYKNATNQKLPKYSGYLSEYGLTKEQWDVREKRIEKKQKKYLEKRSKLNEDENRKIEDNERAFTNWLKNKMKFPVNKTKNMFDFKTNQTKQRTKTK